MIWIDCRLSFRYIGEEKPKHFVTSIRRRNLALKSRELTAEQGLLSLRAQKAEAANKEGAGAARDEEARVLKEHQVNSHT